MDSLTERVDQLDMENKELKKELNAIKINGSSAQVDS